MNKREEQQVFYDGQITIVDVPIPGTNVGFYTRLSLDDLRSEYPNIECIPHAEARARINESAITAPEEISKDDYHSYLGCLPPQHWHGSPGHESFQLSEIYVADVTMTCVRIGHRYVRFRDLMGRDHDELVAKAKRFLETVDV